MLQSFSLGSLGYRTAQLVRLNKELTCIRWDRHNYYQVKLSLPRIHYGSEINNNLKREPDIIKAHYTVLRHALHDRSLYIYTDYFG